MRKRKLTRRLPSPSADVLTKAEVAARLRLSEPSVDRLLQRGKLRRLGGIRKILIPVASVDEYLRGAAS